MFGLEMVPKACEHPLRDSLCTGLLIFCMSCEQRGTGCLGSVLSFQKCFYSKHSRRIEVLSPFRIKTGFFTVQL